MNRSVAIVWLLVAPTALGGTIAFCRACAIAQHGAAAQAQRLDTLRSKCAEIERLRAAVPLIARRSQDEAGLAARVTTALGSAGLPASALSSLSPHTENVRAASGAALIRRKAALALTPVRLPELGAFLEAWRTAEPGWVVSAIDVAPEQAAAATPGTDLPLRVTLVMESLVAEAAGGGGAS